MERPDDVVVRFPSRRKPAQAGLGWAGLGPAGRPEPLRPRAPSGACPRPGPLGDRGDDDAGQSDQDSATPKALLACVSETGRVAPSQRASRKATIPAIPQASRPKAMLSRAMSKAARSHGTPDDCPGSRSAGPGRDGFVNVHGGHIGSPTEMTRWDRTAHELSSAGERRAVGCDPGPLRESVPVRQSPAQGGAPSIPACSTAAARMGLARLRRRGGARCVLHAGGRPERAPGPATAWPVHLAGDAAVVREVVGSEIEEPELSDAAELPASRINATNTSSGSWTWACRPRDACPDCWRKLASPTAHLPSCH